MSQQLKLKYNIMSFPELGLNYWAIPKCMNTSIKYALLKKINKVFDQNIDGSASWVHNIEMHRYITPEQAINNRNENFTCIRHPYRRVKSLYKDFGLRRFNEVLRAGVNNSRLKDIDYFIDYYIKDSTDNDNVHLRSYSYFISSGGLVRIDRVFKEDEIKEYLCKKGIILEHLNVSEGKFVTLTEKHKQIIYNRYKTDFDLFKFVK